MMRVIAGSLKGRRLKAPTWDGLRPTSDKLRETLFNILARGSAARAARRLCHTGALGIERSTSRGAACVTRRARIARAGADRGEPRATAASRTAYAIIRAPWLVRSKSCARCLPDPFDVMLFDPPYDEAPGALIASAGELLASGACSCSACAARAAPDAAGGWFRVRGSQR